MSLCAWAVVSDARVLFLQQLVTINVTNHIMLWLLYLHMYAMSIITMRILDIVSKELRTVEFSPWSCMLFLDELSPPIYLRLGPWGIWVSSLAICSSAESSPWRSELITVCAYAVVASMRMCEEEEEEVVDESSPYYSSLVIIEDAIGELAEVNYK